METVGEVGKMYVNKRTGKVGVLESRDDKYKTLMFRDKDGTSFNVQFSMFRKAWKEYEGDEKIETSTQATKKKKEVEKEVEKAKKEVVKEKKASTGDKRKSFMSEEDKKKLLDSTKTIVDDVVSNSKYKDLFKVDIAGKSSRAGVVIKHNGRRIFEVWPKYNEKSQNLTMLCCKLEVWEEVVFTKKIGEIKADVHPTWNMTHSFNVDNSLVAEATKCVLNASAVVVNRKDEELKNEKKDKAVTDEKEKAKGSKKGSK